MTKKVYRTAQGKMVDLGALQLQNENVRAVGNMGVNARGDILDSRNKSIDSRNRQVAKQYRKQTNVSDAPVSTSRNTPPPAQASKPVTRSEPKPVDASPVESSTPSGGLAAAIARAREIKQEPLDPAPSRNSEGPSRI